MRIQSGDAPDEAIVQPRAFNCQLRVRGLAPGTLAALLRGRSEGRRAWQPGLTVSARLERASQASSGGLQEFNLDDGLALLRSGGEGRVEVGPDHRIGDTLLPISLNLLLAQQWAQAGLLMVHGAAFRFNSTGVLVLGAQSAGKSTLAAAVVAAGGEVVSDDWLLVGATRSDRFYAERLRDFLMLRDGSVTRHLISELPMLTFNENHVTCKLVAPLERVPESIRARFPQTCGIDRLWLLERPGGNRPQASNRRTTTGPEPLATVIEATMPLLFSKRFPAERSVALEAGNCLCASVPIDRVETGRDLVDDPSAVLRALVEPRADDPHR